MTRGVPSGPGASRIVDVVLEATRPPPRRRRLALAVLTAFLVHAVALATALRSGDSLEPWAAALSARIHEELGRETLVETATPPPVPSPPKPPPAPTRERTPAEPRVAARPPPPAQAGQVIAQAPGPDQPRDLTGETFVTGTADAYAGGVTSSTGTNPHPVESPVVDPTAPAQVEDLSRPLGIADTRYFDHCPWPSGADSADVDRVAVAARIEVGPDGIADRVEVANDPGLGFRRAAIDCLARAPPSVWSVALDRSGRPVRASSRFNLVFKR
jgi:hypothetical protein